MTLAQCALLAGVASVLSLWCVRRALAFGPATVWSTYRRLYGRRLATMAPAPQRGPDRWFAPIGARLARTDLAARIEAPRRYAFLAAGVTLPALATRVVIATVAGLLIGLIFVVAPAAVGASVPWVMLLIVPLGFAAMLGWYQLASVVTVAARRYRTFRNGVAAYVQLVAVCMTTRRSMNEAITYAADIGSGPAFDTIGAAVHAAPQMGIRVWEALEAVGQEYDCRELEDLASSVAHVARIGVGVESTVAGVATRMRQVSLDEMQRVADRQTASMVGPSIMFVAGVVLFLGYPLVTRVFEAFTLT